MTHPDAATFATKPGKSKPRGYTVSWWQFVNLGGIGRQHRGTFSSRKAAQAYIANQSAGMSDKDKRRWKVEPIT